MIRKIFMCLSLGTIIQAPAMEPVCYLTQIPSEVQNLIAHFLYETHEEFAARTIAILNKTFTQSFYTNPQYPRFEYCNVLNIPLNDEQHNRGLYVYSPEKTKIAYLNQQGILVILDLTKNKEEGVVYNRQLPLRCGEVVLYPAQIAISEDTTMIALAGDEHNYQDDVENYLNIKAILKIEGLTNNIQKKFSVPTNFRCLLMAFNQQNKHLVAYGTPHKFDDNKRIIVKIFPFTTKENIIETNLEAIINEKSLQQIGPVQKPTLKEHFYLQYICQNLKSSTSN